jgi:hypothetical protein
MELSSSAAVIPALSARQAPRNLGWHPLEATISDVDKCSDGAQSRESSQFEASQAEFSALPNKPRRQYPVALIVGNWGQLSTMPDEDHMSWRVLRRPPLTATVTPDKR